MKKTLLMVLAVLVFVPAVLTAADFWIINARGGVSYPLGQLGENNDLSWNVGASGRKGFDREISIGGGIGYVSMPYKVTSAPQPFTAMIIDAEIAYAPYLPDFIVWPYVKIGVGLFVVKYAKQTGVSPNYTTTMADENAFGLMFGGGVNYPITNEICANLEVMYNQASIAGGQGDNYNFFTFNAGVTMFLK
jgi:opacity protein-like surface antigen